MEEKSHSYHLFLFPFQWDCIPAGKRKKDTDFESRCDLDQCEAQLLQSGWNRNPFEIGEETDSHTDYNEFTYFYDFVRKTIFDYLDPHDKNERLRYFQYNKADRGTYTIHIANPDGSSITYRLHIKNISLHLYNTGVGILTFNLKNDNYPNPEDILRINDYGRRIYPQFLGVNLTRETKNAFLSDKIEVDFADGKAVAVENFEHYNHKANLKEQWFKLPSHITHLFSGTNFTERDSEDDRILITNIMDDRMFTLCWFGNNDKAAELKQWDEKTRQYAYENSDWWYSFIFCDKQWASCENKNMLHENLLDHTYARWANFGTYYGITRETFMAISDEITRLNSNHAAPLYDHTRTIYFQICVLCLVSRASMLRFSGEVARLSDLANHHKISEKTFFAPIEKLYENYIEFLNKIHFREVTAQVQGIELYDMLYQHMNLTEQVKDLDSELDELHRFVNMRRDKARNENAQMLNWIAAFFLPLSAVAGFLGINYTISDNKTWGFDGTLTSQPFGPFWLAVAISTGIALLTMGVIWLFQKRIRNH